MAIFFGKAGNQHKSSSLFTDKVFFPAVPSQWKARALREEMRKHKSPVFGEADVHLQKPTRYSHPLYGMIINLQETS